MEPARLKAILESLLLAAGEPVSASKLAAACEDVSLDEVKGALEDLASEYVATGRGIVLVQIAGGYQLRTLPENAPYVRRLLATRQSRLSRPLLETLAIVAYRQPITRAEIEYVRGVDCAGVLETLLSKRLVRIAGRKAVPGRPLLYATTAEFLETFGLKSIKSLPRIDGLDALGSQTPPEMIIEEAVESLSDLRNQTISEEFQSDEPTPGEEATGAVRSAGTEVIEASQDGSERAKETAPRAMLDEQTALGGADQTKPDSDHDHTTQSRCDSEAEGE
jgi:segregation and condensation protein B